MEIVDFSVLNVETDITELMEYVNHLAMINWWKIYYKIIESLILKSQ